MEWVQENEMDWNEDFISSFSALFFYHCCCCCAPVVACSILLIWCAVAVDTWNGSVHMEDVKKKVAPPPLAHCPIIPSLSFSFFHYNRYSMFVSVARNSIITIKCCLNLWLKLKYHSLTTTTKNAKRKIDSHHKIRLKSRTACVCVYFEVRSTP